MLETNLRHALERNEFALHYQPKIDLTHRRDHRRRGAAALASIRSSACLPPMQVHSGCGGDRSDHSDRPLGAARRRARRTWMAARRGCAPISMAVNLSPRQFLDEHLLQRHRRGAARAAGMPPHLLQLEITESMVMQNVERGIKVLDAIQSRGVRLAIDDFGTGYSSMSLMKQFPIDTIKIDRSFVRDLAENAEDRAIATAIISMGKALGLTVVAEGVETSEQDAFLRRRGCDELQGYLFSKPVPPGGSCGSAAAALMRLSPSASAGRR